MVQIFIQYLNKKFEALVIHCRISVFNCPQHKLIVYKSMDFFLITKARCWEEKEREKRKKFSQFSTFQIPDCYVVSCWQN